MLRPMMMFVAWVVCTLACLVCNGADRVALVIGNSNYAGEAFLRNPVNDAELVAAGLRELGFSVLKKTDLSLVQMQNAVVEFQRALPKEGLGWFFFAGHGLQVKGENYLVPIGARMQEEFEVKRECLLVDQVLEAMADSESNLKVVILDSCRNNPFKRSWSRNTGGAGLAAISNTPEGTIISFSTAPGETADDGAGGNSPYATQLVAALRSRPNGGLELKDLFFNASSAVKRETGQRPWMNLEASLEKYFLWPGTVKTGVGPTPNKPGTVPPAPDTFPPPPRPALIRLESPDASFEVIVDKSGKLIARTKSGDQIWVRDTFAQPILSLKFAPRDSVAPQSYGPNILFVLTGSGENVTITCLNGIGQLFWSRPLQLPGGTAGTELSFSGDTLVIGRFRIKMLDGADKR